MRSLYGWILAEDRVLHSLGKALVFCSFAWRPFLTDYSRHLAFVNQKGKLVPDGDTERDEGKTRRESIQKGIREQSYKTQGEMNG